MTKTERPEQMSGIDKAKKFLEDRAQDIQHLYTFNTSHQLMVEHVQQPTWKAAKQFRPTGVHQIALNRWFVESGTAKDTVSGYTVSRILIGNFFRWHCTCVDFSKNRVSSTSYPYCKHIYAVFRFCQEPVGEPQSDGSPSTPNIWVEIARMKEARPYFRRHAQKYPEFGAYLEEDMPEVYELIRIKNESRTSSADIFIVNDSSFRLTKQILYSVLDKWAPTKSRPS